MEGAGSSTGGAGRSYNAGADSSHKASGQSLNMSVSTVESPIIKLVHRCHRQALNKSLSKRCVALAAEDGGKGSQRFIVAIRGLVIDILDALQQLPNRIRHKRTLKQLQLGLSSMNHDLQKTGRVNSMRIGELRDSLTQIPHQVLRRHHINKMKLDELLHLLSEGAKKNSCSYAIQAKYNDPHSISDHEESFVLLEEELEKIHSHRYCQTDTSVAVGLVKEMKNCGAISYDDQQRVLMELEYWNDRVQPVINNKRHDTPEAQIAFFKNLLESINPSGLELGLALGLSFDDIANALDEKPYSRHLEIILQEASKKGGLVDTNVIHYAKYSSSPGLLEKVAEACNHPVPPRNTHSYIPDLKGLTEDDVISPLLAVKILESNNLVHLRQALEVPVDVAEALENKFIAGGLSDACFALVVNASPITVKKLLRALTHPSLNNQRQADLVCCSQQGLKVRPQIGQDEIYQLLTKLSLKELRHLSELLGVQEEFNVKLSGYCVYPESALNSLLYKDRQATPNNLRYIFRQAGFDNCEKKLLEFYPEASPVPESFPRRAWQPQMTNLGQLTLESPLTEEVIKALPPTGDWIVTGFLLGLEMPTLERIKIEERDNTACSTLMFEALVNKVSLGQLVKVCHQQGCDHILRFLPEHIRKQGTAENSNAVSHRDAFRVHAGSLIQNYAPHWREIAFLLSISPSDLEKIEQTCSHTDKEALLSVLNTARSESKKIPWARINQAVAQW